MSHPAAAEGVNTAARGRASLLRKLAPFVRPHRRLVAAAVALVPAEALLGLAGPYLVKRAIDDAIVPRALALLAPLSLALLAVLLLERLALYGHSMALERCALGVMHDLRRAAHAQLLALRAAFFDRTPVGVLMTRVTSDVEAIGEAVSGGLVTIAGDLLTLAGIVAAMLYLSPELALVSFALLPLLVLVVQVFRRLLRRMQEEIRRRVAEINGALQEHLAGLKVIRAFVREERAATSFDAVNRAHRDAYRASIRTEASLFALVELVGSLTTALLLWYGAERVLGRTVTFGLLVAFIQYLQRFFIPIRDLSAKFTIMQQAAVAAERVFALLDMEAGAEGTSSPAPASSRAGAAVELAGVSFAYQPGQPVLHEVSLAVARGETLAVVGPSGAGKTTVARLLQRMYELDSGAIYLGGRELRALEPAALRRAVVVVSQEVTLFAGSVASNISLSDPAIDASAVEAAARAVGLTRLLALDAPVQERGANLSAGERQLVAFARALCRDPEVLVLDEATSSVDPESERLVQAGIAELTRGRTCIVIAHRLSTIERAQRILVMQRGRVVEEGAHAELLARGGLYARLYELQRIAAR